MDSNPRDIRDFVGIVVYSLIVIPLDLSHIPWTIIREIFEISSEVVVYSPLGYSAGSLTYTVDSIPRNIQDLLGIC